MGMFQRAAPGAPAVLGAVVRLAGFVFESVGDASLPGEYVRRTGGFFPLPPRRAH